MPQEMELEAAWRSVAVLKIFDVLDDFADDDARRAVGGVYWSGGVDLFSPRK